jgi:hypothetical protein
VDRRVGVSLLACGLAACQRPPVTGSASDTFVEGSRLRARWVAAPGTPRLLRGWYDPALGDSCNFENASATASQVKPGDAPLFCLPTFRFSGGTLFADDACTQPVVDVRCDLFHFVAPPRSDPHSCTGAIRLFRAGDPVTNGNVFSNSQGGCRLLLPGDAEAPESPRLFGAEVPLDTLVTGQVRFDAGAGRIVQMTLHASDGSSQPQGAWDTARGEAVSAPDLDTQADGTPGKWEPAVLAFRGAPTNVFSDPACATRVAAFSGCADVTVKAVADYDSPSCVLGEGMKFSEAGVELDSGALYADDGDPSSCRPAQAGDLAPGKRFFAVGAAMPPSSFADVVSFEQGSGQVRIRSAGTADGPVGGGYLRDETWNMACSPQIAADGVLRCLRPVLLNDFYGDPGCTVPVLAVGRSTVPCASIYPDPTVIAVSEVTSQTTCGYAYRLHEFPIVGTHPGEIYWGDPQSCTIYTLPPGDTSITTGYDLGPEIPPDELAPLTVSDPP